MNRDASETEFAALDDLYPLPAGELPRQFVLTQDEGRVPEEWEPRDLAGWTFAAHEAERVAELYAGGRHVGWTTGVLAQLPATAPATLRTVSGSSCPCELPSAGGSAGNAPCMAANADGLSNGDGLVGASAFILIDPAPGGLQRVYLGGLHSVVFDGEKRCVAATANLCAPLQRELGLRPRRGSAEDPTASTASG